MEENQEDIGNEQESQETGQTDNNETTPKTSWKLILVLGIFNIIRGILGGTLGPVFLVIGICCIGYVIYTLYGKEE